MKRLLIVMAIISCSTYVCAETPAPDPIAARQALSALFAASDAAIPKASSCNGDYGQKGRATVRDLLAMELAYLYSGDNAINGACAANSCSVKITHSAGEDVSSATIDFKTKNGRAIPSTLACIITP